MSNTEHDDPPIGAEESGAADGSPRWAAVLGIVVVLLVLALFVFLHLSGIVGPEAH